MSRFSVGYFFLILLSNLFFTFRIFYGHTIRSDQEKKHMDKYIMRLPIHCCHIFRNLILNSIAFSLSSRLRFKNTTIRHMHWKRSHRFLARVYFSLFVLVWNMFYSLAGIVKTSSTCRNRNEHFDKNTDTQEYSTTDCRKACGPNRSEKKRTGCVTRYIYASETPYRQLSVATKWFHQMWATTVCFVPLFFSTSTDFELNGTTQPCGSVE